MKLVPLLFTCFLFGILGLRLYRIGTRSGGSERSLAIFFLLTAFAMPLRMLAIEGFRSDALPLAQLTLLGHMLLSGSVAAFVVFIWRVFRPNTRWAAAFAWATIGFQVLAIPLLLWTGGHRNEQHPILLLINGARMTTFLWAFVESILYYRMMVKRRELGLANPVVTNRFALFGIWNGALFAVPLVALTARIIVNVAGFDMVADPSNSAAVALMRVVRSTLGLTGVTAFIAMTLSFFPPQGYIAWVSSHAGAAKTP